MMTSFARPSYAASHRAISKASGPCRTFFDGCETRCALLARETPGSATLRAGNNWKSVSETTPKRRALLFEWSMAEFVERYLSDERLQMAYLGQGVIGTNASPFDPGTASIRFHHSSGRLGGLPGSWGYVKGGMGMVSFFLADAAQRAGATVACGVPVAQILPGEGVLLEGGERIHAPVVVSNADRPGYAATARGCCPS